MTRKRAGNRHRFIAVLFVILFAELFRWILSEHTLKSSPVDLVLPMRPGTYLGGTNAVLFLTSHGL